MNETTVMMIHGDGQCFYLMKACGRGHPKTFSIMTFFYLDFQL